MFFWYIKMDGLTSEIKTQRTTNSGNLMPDEFEKFTLEPVETRMISLMRLILSIAALITTFLDPTEPDRLVEITYTTLFLYCLYSGGIYWLSVFKPFMIPNRYVHWIDVLWYLLLISLSSGTNSLFFFFFFFAILTASFRWGFKLGLSVSLVSAVLFTVVGYFTSPQGPDFQLNRFLLRPIYLSILGYMIAYWGGKEINFIKRLALLKEVNKLSNPRFGVDQTIGSVLSRLRSFYDANSCLFINQELSSFTLREIDRQRPNQISKTESADECESLVKLPGEYAIYYKTASSVFLRLENYGAFDGRTGEQIELSRRVCEVIANLMDVKSFITVPVLQRGEMTGRLYVTSNEARFNRSDVDFLRQLVDQIMPVIENVGLLDRLASEAATRQLQKIARDIHDSTIQPYIGLKLGLEAIEAKHKMGEQIGKDLEKLIQIADTSIGDLRGFVRNLKDGKAQREGTVLVTAVRQQAAKFQEFYGIKVGVETSDGFMLNDRLAAEVFQIVTEGLSNIRRHTKAKQVNININSKGNLFVLDIENDNENAESPSEFLPRSITGRAEALGGTVDVKTLNGQTKVSVKIPL